MQSDSVTPQDRRGGLQAVAGAVPDATRSNKAGHLYAAALIALLAGSELNFRLQGTDPAAEGSLIDGQILIELTLWGLAGTWMCWRMFGPDAQWLARYPIGVGPALRVVCAIALVSTGSAVYVGDPYGLIRVLQFVIFAGLMLLLYRDISLGKAALVAFWLWTRRGMWILSVVASVLTPLLPRFRAVAVMLSGGTRYSWFSMGPIATGRLLGIAVLTLVGHFLLHPDTASRSRRVAVLRVACLVGSTGLLMATKGRGAIVATLAGVMVLIALTPYPRRRAHAVLLISPMLLVLAAGFGTAQLADALVRGQSRDQLLSLTGRNDIFRIAWRLFLEQPLLGYGYGRPRLMFYNLVEWAPVESHNAIVEIAIGLGIVGLALYAWLFMRLGRQLAAAAISAGITPVDLCAREAAGILVLLLGMGMIDDGFAWTGSQQMFLIVACLIADVWWLQRRERAADWRAADHLGHHTGRHELMPPSSTAPAPGSS